MRDEGTQGFLIRIGTQLNLDLFRSVLSLFMMASLRLTICRYFLFFLQKRLHYVADNFIPDLFYYVQCLLWISGPQLKKCVSLFIGHTVTNNSVENLIIGFGKCLSHRAIPIEHCVSACSFLTVRT